MLKHVKAMVVGTGEGGGVVAKGPANRHRASWEYEGT